MRRSSPALVSGHALQTFFSNSSAGALFLFHAHRCRSQRGYLFTHPQGELVCQTWDDVSYFFKRLQKLLDQGFYLAGYLTYELAYAWEKTNLAPRQIFSPLAWFGIFPKPQVVPRTTWQWLRQVRAQQSAWPDYWLRSMQPTLSTGQYLKQVKRIQAYIAQGDTYQVNYTFPLQTQIDGNAGSLFFDMYQQQPVGYAAYLRGGGRTLLSLSPELFFERYGETILARPMKGTAARSANQKQDRLIKQQLIDSHKDRAENVMIVDLLRNDLGRLCQPGTIQVPRLFQVETYRTIYQMTSTIVGRLHQVYEWQPIFRSLFPCGSVTGAPKIRTMQIINELEPQSRGVYTGAIGYIAPSGQAQFNVPIRTLEINNQARQACFHVGSGIVADSQPMAEWNESLAKAKFLFSLARDYQLIETMRWDPPDGYQNLDLHLKRLLKSAQTFGIPCSLSQVQQELAAFARKQKWQGSQKVRLLLYANGQRHLSSQPLPAKNFPDHAAGVKLSRHYVNSSNLFLYHKTTNREMYNQALAQAQTRGLVEVLFQNQHQALTEGTITNLFVRKGRAWLTPPIADGLLPGIARSQLLQSKAWPVVEHHLYRRDLIGADEIRLANSVRGFFPVKLVL